MHHHVPAWIVASVVAALSASCVADVGDSPDEPVGSAAQRGIHYGYDNPRGPKPAVHFDGPCGATCYDLASDLCGDWEDECADAHPFDLNVTCAGRTVSCFAARQAATATAGGIGVCWRECMGLR